MPSMLAEQAGVAVGRGRADDVVGDVEVRTELSAGRNARAERAGGAGGNLDGRIARRAVGRAQALRRAGAVAVAAADQHDRGIVGERDVDRAVAIVRGRDVDEAGECWMAACCWSTRPLALPPDAVVATICVLRLAICEESWLICVGDRARIAGDARLRRLQARVGAADRRGQRLRVLHERLALGGIGRRIREVLEIGEELRHRALDLAFAGLASWSTCRSSAPQ